MKKIICISFCIIMLLMSCMAFEVSAAQTTSTDCIYFEVPTGSDAEWKNFAMIYCHIWCEGEDGGDFYAWQSKNERCTDLGNGVWSYDISSLEFKSDKTYSVIFSNNNGMQTYNLTITSACKGDIVKCSDEVCANPVDAEKDCVVARWLENADTVHPCAMIDSQGYMLDPDWIAEKDVDTSWGESEGVTVELPEVAPTQAPTEEQTQAQNNDSAQADDSDDADDEDEDDSDKSDEDNNAIVWYIAGGAVALIAVVVAVVMVVKKKK